MQNVSLEIRKQNSNYVTITSLYRNVFGCHTVS